MNKTYWHWFTIAVAVLFVIALVFLLLFCSVFFVETVYGAPAESDALMGIAGWYGPGFYWKPMKNGEIYNPTDLIFAMNQGYPDDQDYLLVWTGKVITPDGWVDLGKTGIVRARWTDTGSFTKRYGRVADLSPATMRKLTGGLGFYYGLIKVRIYPCADLHMERR